MSSQEYWKNREEENRRKNQKTEVEYERELREIYDYMMDQIQREINGFYAKYAKQEGITLAEAKKRASKLDIEEYARKAKKYVKEKDFSKEANDEMRLYNMTMKVNRLELLKANIGLELVSGFDELQKFFDEKLTERTLEEFERQAGILGKSVLDNQKAAHAIVNASFKNATFSDRIWMYQDMMKSELAQLLKSGLIQGKNPRQLARHLEKRFGVSKYHAERLMITELARVQTEAQKQSYERNGNDEYIFLALNPKGPCEVCKALDGKIFKVKDMMPGENASPMHPFCHCSIAPKRNRQEYEERIDYLDKGGTTEEWEKLKSKGFQSGGKNITGGKWYKPYDVEDKKDNAASKEYRKISRRNDVSVIADNSGFKKEDIQQIKRHIFFNKHQKYDGYGMLYPDYDMAVAWKRLYEGAPEERDILLLKHELLESQVEKKYNLTIAEAHELAKKEYDWEAKLIEDLGEDGEPYGLL